MVLIFGLLSCSYRKEKGADQGQDRRQDRLTEDATVTWEMVKEQIFEARCTECHSEMSDYSQVKLNLSEIMDNIRSDRMPKTGPKLSDDLKEMLEVWVSAGAPLGTEEDSE